MGTAKSLHARRYTASIMKDLVYFTASYEIMIKSFINVSGPSLCNCASSLQLQHMYALSQGGPWGPASPPIEMLFQVFRLNFSRDIPKMQYFSNKFSKIAKR